VSFGGWVARRDLSLGAGPGACFSRPRSISPSRRSARSTISCESLRPRGRPSPSQPHPRCLDSGVLRRLRRQSSGRRLSTPLPWGDLSGCAALCAPSRELLRPVPSPALGCPIARMDRTSTLSRAQRRGRALPVPSLPARGLADLRPGDEVGVHRLRDREGGDVPRTAQRRAGAPSHRVVPPAPHVSIEPHGERYATHGGLGKTVNRERARRAEMSRFWPPCASRRANPYP
jgi:hypothetical protein